MGILDRLLGGLGDSPKPPASWLSEEDLRSVRVDAGLEPSDPSVGQVKGQHYTQCVDEVKALKREGRLDEAESLLLKACDAAEAEAEAVSYGIIPPWYYDQLAIIYRKQGRCADEVSILERYVAKRSEVEHGEVFCERLEKARALLHANQNEPQSFCPYCGVEIAPMPKSTRKCPTCGERVVVGKRLGEEVKSLLTEEEAEEIKLAQEEAREHKKFMSRASKLGYSVADVEKTTQRLLREWGSTPSPRDLIWTMTNEAVSKACAGGICDWAALGRAYQVQAEVLEEEGKRTYEADLRAHDAMLHYFEGVFANMDLRPEVRVSSRKGCCPECAELSGRVFSIADALEQKVLPNPNCRNGRCKCGWSGNYSQ